MVLVRCLSRNNRSVRFSSFVRLSDAWNGLVKILPIHESVKLPPNLCPILSDNLHWSEIEAAGMKSWSESARQSIKFILFGVVGSSLAIGAYLGNGDFDGVYPNNLSAENEERFILAKKILTGGLVGSFLFFGFNFLRPISIPILKRIVMTGRQVKGAPIGWFVEFNIYRTFLATGLITLLTNQPGLFNNRFEEYMLAGTLGGIIGSVFSGIHLARARSALSMLGPFGLISGLAGYTCFRSFDSFSNEAMLTDNNRREIVSGLLTPMLPYILLGATYLYFVAGFQIAAISNLYGATCAGGLTGGYLAKKISQNQVDLKKYFDNLYKQLSS